MADGRLVGAGAGGAGAAVLATVATLFLHRRIVLLALLISATGFRGSASSRDGRFVFCLNNFGRVHLLALQFDGAANLDSCPTTQVLDSFCRDGRDQTSHRADAEELLRCWGAFLALQQDFDAADAVFLVGGHRHVAAGRVWQLHLDDERHFTLSRGSQRALTSPTHASTHRHSPTSDVHVHSSKQR